MHDGRWTLGVAENGDIRLRDQKTGETLRFGGVRGLYDALGVLADWRETKIEESKISLRRHAAGCWGAYGMPCTGQCKQVTESGA